MWILFRGLMLVSVITLGLTANAAPTLQEIKEQYFSIKREIARSEAVERTKDISGNAKEDAKLTVKLNIRTWSSEEIGSPVFDCQDGTGKFFGAGRFAPGDKPEPFASSYYRSIKYPFNTLTGDLFDLAYDILTAKHYLKEAGYPEEIWRKILVDGEDETIREAHRRTINKPRWAYEGIQQKYKKRLIKNLNDFASNHKDKFSRVVETAECGAGESEFQINTDPPGIMVEIMPQMLAKLCVEQKKDLMLGESCPYWKRLDPPVNVLMSGTYRIRLASPGGGSSLRVVDFDKVTNGILKIKQ